MDQLHKVVRLADLPDYTGLRRTQIQELIAQGKFPKPVKLSARRMAWLADEIAVWQQQRIAERDANITMPKIQRVAPIEPRPAPGMYQARGPRR